MGIELNKDQIFASYEAQKWKANGYTDQVFEISGRAGTGKTTTVKYILQEMGLDPQHDVLFVAFTGKAASQLSKQNVPAITCHSAFYEYKKEYDRLPNGRIIYNEAGKPKLKGVFKKKEYLKKRYKLIVIDEATMINQKMRDDILSFGLPVIALGDMNQLPPVFGDPVFLNNPDVTLHQIMRQREGDPIVYIAEMVLDNLNIKYGVYKKSSVIRRSDLNEYQMKHADIILTGTNNLRREINRLFREDYLQFPKLEFPYVGEKVICKRNDWSKCLSNNIYLTNGTTGFLDYVDRESYNGRSMKIDFRPDFTNKVFRDLSADYRHLMEIQDVNSLNLGLEMFEFAYAITCHSSQGSQWENVLAMGEMYGSKEFQKKMLYTMVTRASESITLVL